MNNHRPPASKLRKWLMGNNESTLPGLMQTALSYSFSQCTIATAVYCNLGNFQG